MATFLATKTDQHVFYNVLLYICKWHILSLTWIQIHLHVMLLHYTQKPWISYYNFEDSYHILLSFTALCRDELFPRCNNLSWLKLQCCRRWEHHHVLLSLWRAAPLHSEEQDGAWRSKLVSKSFIFFNCQTLKMSDKYHWTN